MTPPIPPQGQGNQSGASQQQGGNPQGGQPGQQQGGYNPYAQQQGNPQQAGQPPMGYNPYAQQPPQGGQSGQQQGGYNPYAQQQGNPQQAGQPPMGYNPYAQQPPQGGQSGQQQGGYNPYAQQQGNPQQAGQPPMGYNPYAQQPPQGGQPGQQQGGYNPYAQPGQQGAYPPQPEVVTQPIGTFGFGDDFKTKIKIPPHKLSFDENLFLKLLAGSISLTKDEKKRIIEAVPQLTQFQVDELIRILTEEKTKFAELDIKHKEQLDGLSGRHHQEWEELEAEMTSGDMKANEQAELEKARAAAAALNNKK